MLRDTMCPADKGHDPSLGDRVATLGLEPLVAAADGTALYLVGGAVRDLLLGGERSDVDVAVEGDAIALARRLGGDVHEHERFGTAKVHLDGLEVDLAGTRAEEYPAPGSLPVVRPAALAEDLARRDFTVNAMAVPLAEPNELIDPHGGRQDLDSGRLRVLHTDSFRDDPTRALRAARYAARFGFTLELGTERLLQTADLDTVSTDRVDAELLRLAEEPEWRRGLELLGEWGLVEAADLDLAAAVRETLSRPGWGGSTSLAHATLVAGGVAAGLFAAPLTPLRDARELAVIEPGSPSRLAAAARDASPLTLVLARSLGAEWLDSFIEEWRNVRLEIGGEDLLAAGVAQGPAVGRGLAAALAAKLDGEASGRDDELRIALAAARRPSA